MELPHFDLQDLRDFSTSPYLMNMVYQYLNHSKNVRFMYNTRYPNMLKVYGITSKNSRNDTKSGPDNKPHILSLDGFDFLNSVCYCKCQNGPRTSGCCVHSLSSLFLLYHKINHLDIPIVNTRTNKYLQNTVDLYHFQNKGNTPRESSPSDVVSIHSDSPSDSDGSTPYNPENDTANNSNPSAPIDSNTDANMSSDLDGKSEDDTSSDSDAYVSMGSDVDIPKVKTTLQHLHANMIPGSAQRDIHGAITYLHTKNHKDRIYVIDDPDNPGVVLRTHNAPTSQQQTIQH
eukprot:275598_1